VRFERHVRAGGGWLVDVVRVAADRERLFTLHMRADTHVSVRHTGAGSRSHWPGDGGLVGLHTALCTTPTDLGDDGGTVAAVLSTGADLGPADDPQRSRPHLRWRVHADNAVFASVYAPAGSEPAGLHLERSGSELTVHVDLAGGSTIRWPITLPISAAMPLRTPEQELR
jgi:hypothetical protein